MKKDKKKLYKIKKPEVGFTDLMIKGSSTLKGAINEEIENRANLSDKAMEEFDTTNFIEKHKKMKKDKKKNYKRDMIIWVIFLMAIFVFSLVAWTLSENDSLNIVFITLFLSVFPTLCFVLSYYFIKRNISLSAEYFAIINLVIVAPVIFVVDNVGKAIIFLFIVGIISWCVLKLGKIPKNKQKAELIYAKRAGIILFALGIILSVFVIYTFIKNLVLYH